MGIMTRSKYQSIEAMRQAIQRAGKGPELLNLLQATEREMAALEAEVVRLAETVGIMAEQVNTPKSQLGAAYAPPASFSGQSSNANKEQF